MPHFQLLLNLASETVINNWGSILKLKSSVSIFDLISSCDLIFGQTHN